MVEFLWKTGDVGSIGLLGERLTSQGNSERARAWQESGGGQNVWMAWLCKFCMHGECKTNQRST
jgi:hypothetical protein